MKPKTIELSSEEAAALFERVENNSLSSSDHKILKALLETYILLQQAVAQKSSTVKKLLQIVFGHKTEKTNRQSKPKKQDKGKNKRKGHGRKSAKEYTGAKKVKVSHTTLHHCDPCPDCQDGKIYRQTSPGVVIRITGAPPLQATCYEMDKLRCNICGKLFTADLPGEAGDQKYDANASAMLGLLRYGTGLPLNRIARLQGEMGIPLAPSTQWDVIERMAGRIAPVFIELIKQAAQGQILYNDDTTIKIQTLIAENQDSSVKTDRTGMYTSGVVSILGDRKIALFFTGRNHAGENIAEVLLHRHNCLDPPIQMCDALSRNSSEEFKKLLAFCLTHGRRNFVSIADDFPEECLHVTDTLGTVYENDAVAREKGMTPEQRLNYHQSESGPPMDKLFDWLNEKMDKKEVEPNSTLGKAIQYMRNHWQELTLFLRVENAPLDNNICERALKMSILHRKNSLFYKTLKGAYVGDLFMSIIHTCALMKINPFHYLTTLQRNSSALRQKPNLWLPWNYTQNLSI
jgi:transposase